MFATVLLASALALTQTEKWELKAPVAPKTTSTFAVTLKVDMGGEAHEAALNLKVAVADNAADKPLAAEVSWIDLLLDGGQAMPDVTWDVVLNGQGAVTESKGEAGDSIRRMLIPMMFVYPSNPVSVGDSWKEVVKAGTDKNDISVTHEFKAEGMEKVNDVDVMKISEKMTEAGSDAMSATGNWWVDKTGAVLKFTMKVKNWVVPMAGDQAMDVEISGNKKA